MTYEFESLLYSQALKMADEGETWLVDNIIGSSTTLIYGEAKSGKSFLVSALIKSLATGADFLNKPVPQIGHSRSRCVGPTTWCTGIERTYSYRDAR